MGPLCDRESFCKVESIGVGGGRKLARLGRLIELFPLCQPLIGTLDERCVRFVRSSLRISSAALKLPHEA